LEGWGTNGTKRVLKGSEIYINTWDAYTCFIVWFLFYISNLFCNDGLLVGSFSGVNLRIALENRAASGHEAPKALQKFSMETGFQVSGNIILLLFSCCICGPFSLYS
jgi:hypothetical protein